MFRQDDEIAYHVSVLACEAVLVIFAPLHHSVEAGHELLRVDSAAFERRGGRVYVAVPKGSGTSQLHHEELVLDDPDKIANGSVADTFLVPEEGVYGSPDMTVDHGLGSVRGAGSIS